MRMVQQVLGVILENVLTRLSLKFAHERLQFVKRHRDLATILRCLGRVELGEQAADNSSIVDMAKQRSVPHTFP